MQDDRQPRENAELRRFIIRKMARDLSMVYPVETQLPPRLQEYVQRLDEQQEQINRPPQLAASLTAWPASHVCLAGHSRN
jgi:hypothetical protein